MLLNNLNAVSVSTFVAKVNLEILSREEIELGLYPNINDCFMISEDFSNRMEVNFRKPKETDFTSMKPIEGDKLIGAFRDKGSVTGVMKRYIPVVDFKVRTVKEGERLITALKEIRGENTPYKFFEDRLIVSFPIDIIANPSTGRDNVSALMLQSAMELKAILEGIEVAVDNLEEVGRMNLEEILEEREQSHVVNMLDITTGEIVYSFGEVPVLIEDFFWQPKHSNSIYCKEKYVSLNYHQAIDGMQILLSSLHKAMLNSLDYDRIKEHIMVLGLDIVEDCAISELVNQLENSADADEFDL